MRGAIFANLAVFLFAPFCGFSQSPNSIFIQAPLNDDVALAAKGDVTALTRLGYRSLIGLSGVVDSNQAYQYLTAASSKSPAASAWLGFAAVIRPELSSRGVDGVGLVMKASELGDPVGMTLLGRLYHRGRGVPQNTTTARQLYKQAAPRFALAYAFLGESYLESSNSADHSRAILYFLNGASAGETESMIQLAVMYTRGDGVTRDYASAAKWLDQAQQRGDPVASFQRGALYHNGLGVPKSHAEAVTLYRRAALAGYAPAQAALGMCYATGSGVTKDFNQAIYWLSLAAPTFPYAVGQLALIRAGGLQ